MSILTTLFIATSVVGVLLVATGILSWAMAQGLLAEGSTLYRAASRLLGWVDKFAALFFALILGVAIVSGRKRKAAPIRDQARAHAKTRADGRVVRAAAARKVRELDAAVEGQTAAIRFTADNRVEAIRAEVAAMDDDALLDAAREVGR